MSPAPLDTSRGDRSPAVRPKGRSMALARGVGIGALLIALVVGIQLGRIPWRYRRQILLTQGFLVGALVGYVVGRVSGSGRSEPEG